MQIKDGVMAIYMRNLDLHIYVTANQITTTLLMEKEKIDFHIEKMF